MEMFDDVTVKVAIWYAGSDLTSFLFSCRCNSSLINFVICSPSLDELIMSYLPVIRAERMGAVHL